MTFYLLRYRRNGEAHDVTEAMYGQDAEQRARRRADDLKDRRIRVTVEEVSR